MKIVKIFDYHKTRIVDLQEEGTHNRVSIYPISGEAIYGRGKTVYGVNWSANGTVSVDEAQNYITLIQAALVECKKQNKENA